MSLKMFMAENVEKAENIKHVVSQRYKDEEGNPLKWELKAITSEKDTEIRKSCTKRVATNQKRTQFTQETDAELYLAKLAVNCVVMPNLHDAELQNSYGVMGAESLLKTMLLPGEYNDMMEKIQEINGFDVDINEMVEEAKN